MITLSEAAVTEIKRIIEESIDGEDPYLRVAIEGGGCSGFQYKLGFIEPEGFDEQTDAKYEQDGIFIVVEKILGETSDLNNMYNKAYYQMKQDNGYTQEEIDRRKMSLEGVLVPLTGKFNEQLIKSAGFKYIDCFWRWMNFAGWIAIK